MNETPKTLEEEVKESVKKIEKLLDEKDKLNKKKKMDLDKTCELYLNIKDKK